MKHKIPKILIILFSFIFLCNVWGAYSAENQAAESLTQSACIIHGDAKGKEAYLNFIRKGKGPLFAGSYKLHEGQLPDQEIIDALGARAKVRVVLESRLTEEERRNYQDLPIGSSLKKYQGTGATLVADLKNYKNAHLKLLWSPHLAIIGTTNYDEPESKTHNKRDFSAIIANPEILNEILFNLDQVIAGKPLKVFEYKVADVKIGQTRLTWPPQILGHILEMIRSAKKEIIIYQQSMQSILVTEALEESLKNGIKVSILMSEFPFGKKNPNKSLENLLRLKGLGAKVYLTGNKIVESGKTLHIHAKILLIDPGTNDALMLLGSYNFYDPVLDPKGDNLNLGILTRDKSYIGPVYLQAAKDISDHADQILGSVNKI